MRVDEEGKIWVRQSWLNDVMICPERARLSVKLPDWRQDSDATIIGTAVHAGIEGILTRDYDNDDATIFAIQTMNSLTSELKFKMNSTSGIEEMRYYVELLMGTFIRDILPNVKFGGKVEQNFGIPLYERDGQQVWLGGTIDYIDPDGVIWDWKTAARKYSQGEKQRQSIQATAYAIACVENGWSSDYPVRFNYGVMTRTQKSVGQIVPVVRTSSHVDWFKHQVQSVMQTFTSVGLDSPWMANDQHGLCSQKWCPYWSICKGSRLSDFENNNIETTEEVN